MSRKHLIFLITFFAMILITTGSQHVKWPGIKKIRESCERDIQCIRHAFCKVQKTCLCDTYYAPSLDMATCHVTIGAPCNDEYETCETMSNAECRQNVCTCKDSYIIDINNSSNCIKRPKAPGDICQRPDECQESMDKALCINGKCSCYTNHHFVNETGTCIRMRGPYEPCKRDHECLINEKNPNELECRNGECAFRERNKGSLIYQPFFVLATFALATIFSNVYVINHSLNLCLS